MDRVDEVRYSERDQIIDISTKTVNTLLESIKRRDSEIKLLKEKLAKCTCNCSHTMSAPVSHKN
jgi:redox-regulated HSP33 family molecular chaperone